MQRREPYVIINTILAAVLMLIFVYSFFFPWLYKNGATIPSSCEGLPALYCKSRGLSRAFAQIMYGDILKARQFNAYAVSVFTFFLVELMARGIFSILFLRLKKDFVIYSDCVLSVVYFLAVFVPMVIP